MENEIHLSIEALLDKIGVSINKIRIEQDEEGSYKVNIETSHPNLMIGHRGENIGALQHLIKLVLWNKAGDGARPNINLDVENYRRRQEQQILQLAERKVEMVRKLTSPQSLPAMSPYFRRAVHMHLTQNKFEDVCTESKGEGEYRYIIIKPEVII
jgi:spoIIIJ-associated protein